VEEKLFTGSEHKIAAAIAAFKEFIDEFHGLPPTARRPGSAVLPLSRIKIRVVLACFRQGVGCERNLTAPSFRNWPGPRRIPHPRRLVACGSRSLRGERNAGKQSSGT
jgi:hypothetical protein